MRNQGAYKGEVLDSHWLSLLASKRQTILSEESLRPTNPRNRGRFVPERETAANARVDAHNVQLP